MCSQLTLPVVLSKQDVIKVKINIHTIPPWALSNWSFDILKVVFFRLFKHIMKKNCFSWKKNLVNKIISTFVCLWLNKFSFLETLFVTTGKGRNVTFISFKHMFSKSSIFTFEYLFKSLSNINVDSRTQNNNQKKNLLYNSKLCTCFPMHSSPFLSHFLTIQSVC